MTELTPSKFKYVISDFDGVMTDGKVHVSENGTESVVCSRLDGIGVRLLKRNGIKTIILSSEQNRVVAMRANKLGVEAHIGIESKSDFLVKYLEENLINPEDVLYIGDEVNDLEVFEMLPFTVCPMDANPLIKNKSTHILPIDGGQGVIRYIAEEICLIKKWR
jgi:3-deoxy-D-manno-octulosonate 8-phosphate phosphatase (KDO 8-P phosphatase)